MQLSVGKRLGPYEVVGLLGAGGMGVVYRARDPRLGREVALKVLPAEVALDRGRLERFRREARAVAALNHPNILSVHDVGTEGDTHYVVFELLEGTTLREHLAGGPLPVPMAVDLAAQVLRGLGAAHRKGIVHRDIKPENLLVVRGGHLKILDFGLAKAVGSEGGRHSAEETASAATEPGGRVGTAAYMSPEQARGLPVDHRSDLFSLGVVLHEMLGGAHPFRRDTTADTVVAILKEPPGPLPPTAVEEAPGIGPILARCLAKDPDDRFQSAADLEFALQQGLGAVAPGESRQVARGGAARSRVAAALLVTALVAGGVGLFLGRGATPDPPAYRKLTFRTGSVASARFSPDGQTVFFSGRWAGPGMETLVQRLDAPDPRALELPAGRVVRWVDGELAIVTTADFTTQAGFSPGELLRVPAEGGGARVVAEGVSGADWARDGSAFAVVRRDGGVDRLEYPLGRPLYSSPGSLAQPRISPDGRRVAFLEQPVRGEREARIGIVDAGGDVAFLTEPLHLVSAIAWSPKGREVWASGWLRQLRNGGSWSVVAVTPSGHRRLLLWLPSSFRLLDVTPRGEALVALDEGRMQTMGRLAGDDRERELAFRDSSFLMDLSPDGRTILFFQYDLRYSRVTAFLRRAAEEPIRLDFGEPQSLSPDGSRITLRESESLRVIPTGVGESAALPRGTIAHYFNSRWLPDGQRILVAGQEEGRPKRLFLQDVPDGLPRPVTPEGIMTMYPAISPDGRWVAAGLEEPGSVQQAWPLDGGEPRPLRGLEPGDWVVRWGTDGQSVFAYEKGRGGPPWPVLRVDLQTGRREVWKELEPASSSPLSSLARVHVTPDGQSYGYTFQQSQSDLYLVTGLR